MQWYIISCKGSTASTPNNYLHTNSHGSTHENNLYDSFSNLKIPTQPSSVSLSLKENLQIYHVRIRITYLFLVGGHEKQIHFTKSILNLVSYNNIHALLVKISILWMRDGDILLFLQGCQRYLSIVSTDYKILGRIICYLIS